jgi:plasmid stabilization system protein ParE
VIVFDEGALADLERILAFLMERDPSSPLEHLDRIRSAVLVLDQHPNIGRPIGGGSTLRELIISEGRTGYVALYEYDQADRIIRVVAVRHQRQAGYRGH